VEGRCRWLSEGLTRIGTSTHIYSDISLQLLWVTLHHSLRPGMKDQDIQAAFKKFPEGLASDVDGRLKPNLEASRPLVPRNSASAFSKLLSALHVAVLLRWRRCSMRRQ
jgi:hypothetical protein